MTLDINRKHWSIFAHGKRDGYYYVGIVLFNKVDFGLSRHQELDFDELKQGPYYFYVQKMINGGWGPIKTWNIPFSDRAKG